MSSTIEQTEILEEYAELRIQDRSVLTSVIRERRKNGSDRYDEVWDGVYIVSPLANNELQNLITQLAAIMTATVQWASHGHVFAGVNVSDQEEDWRQDYRVPDVGVFLNDTKATNRGTHWFGGPDFAVEIVSPNDRTREKLDFYASVGTRELLVIDRDPWGLELYRLRNDQLAIVASSTVENGTILASETAPLSFRLRKGEPRPHIEVVHQDGQQNWTI
ncbi:Uma2 family endonuclease [Thalassoroseus pseudoceratinae]|uniref:Uma2 family endonuclease n=1 Tax=Thalassoroseus pseudoceratinae TaxID=2713176 RepID=UPI00141EAB6F|nr:Uma2 family endonuclease [Thalassoroseus pseudoceratinae]